MTIPLTGSRCLCNECGLVLKGERNFDRHRTGRFEGDGGENTRRCLSEFEMRQRGMEPDKYGVWRVPAPEGAVFAARSAHRQAQDRPASSDTPSLFAGQTA